MIFFMDFNFEISFVGCKLDIGFVLDESGSIGHRGFNDELHFVKNIAKQFQVSRTNTHVSIMTFSNNAIMRVRFRDIYGQSSQHLQQAIDKIKYRGWLS